MVKVVVPINQIHKYTIDGDDFVQFDIQFPEHPELPTYNLIIAEPFTVLHAKEIIREKTIKVMKQLRIDETIRENLTDILELNIEA